LGAVAGVALEIGAALETGAAWETGVALEAGAAGETGADLETGATGAAASILGFDAVCSGFGAGFGFVSELICAAGFVGAAGAADCAGFACGAALNGAGATLGRRGKALSRGTSAGTLGDSAFTGLAPRLAGVKILMGSPVIRGLPAALVLPVRQALQREAPGQLQPRQAH